MAICAISTICLILVFRFEADPHAEAIDNVQADTSSDKTGNETPRTPGEKSSDAEESPAYPPTIVSPPVPKSALLQAMKNRNALIISFFTFVYVGVEVSQGGWIVSFLVNERDGGPSVG